MATKERYRPVIHAPPPARLSQENRQFETPQLKIIPYRGKMTPGNEPTYRDTKAKSDKRKGDV